jgi:hypothetical protein
MITPIAGYQKTVFLAQDKAGNSASLDAPDAARMTPAGGFVGLACLVVAAMLARRPPR